jgi:hydrophobic/amphiphilic exporter-1 (mainly G- bacteria), HAE1 family
MSQNHTVRPGVLPSFSLNRPVTVTMILFTTLAIGIIAYMRIPITKDPVGVDYPFVSIYASWNGHSRSDLDKKIALPIIGMLRTIPGVKSANSHVWGGGCNVWVEFNGNTDMKDAFSQVLEMADRIRPELPDDVKSLRVNKYNPNESPILTVRIPFDSTDSELAQLIKDVVETPIERTDGVAKIGSWGSMPYRRVEVNLIRDRLHTHQISVSRLISQMSSENSTLSCGSVSVDNREHYIRSTWYFDGIADLREMPIRGSHRGLKLSDVADVGIAAPYEDQWRSRVEGKKCVTINVYRESGANTVALCRKVTRELRERISGYPRLNTVGVRVYDSRGEEIEEGLDQLAAAGTWGGLFAILVVFAFLRKVRITLLVAGAIPLSVLVSITVIYFMGWSLNKATMMAMIISFGMVVDNSIIVVESIFGRVLGGEDSRTAALNGTSEVGLAITVATMTTVVVFLPLIFIGGGVEGARLSRMGMPVVFALTASLVVALLFVPQIAFRAISTRSLRESRVIKRLGDIYERGVSWVVNHRFEAFLLACAVSATILIPMEHVKDGRQSHFWPRVGIRVSVPSWYSIDQRDSIVSAYEKFAIENREKYGATSVNVHMGERYSFVAFQLPVRRPKWHTVLWHSVKSGLGMDVPKDWTRNEIQKDFRENAPRFAGVPLSVDPKQPTERKTTVSLFGDDMATLERLASEVERRVVLIPGVNYTTSSVESGDQVVELTIRARTTRAHGLTPRMVANTVRSAGVGLDLTRVLTVEGKRMRIHVALDEGDKASISKLLNLPVSVDSGMSVPVGSLVDVQHRATVGGIHRQNGRANVQVSVVTSMMAARGMRGKIEAAMVGLELPRGYTWSFDRWFRDQKKGNETMRIALTLAIVLVFLLMGILFESFLLPLAILLTVPLSFLGVYWMLYLTGTDFSSGVWMGMIILVGIVVNNAIVLVDLVNRLRKKGYSRNDAIVEAGRRRFRPILMTSLTTICGLIPMSVEGAQSVNQGLDVLGKVLIGGLMTSTFLTLFVVPLFYTFLDDAREVMKQVFSVTASRT